MKTFLNARARRVKKPVGIRTPPSGRLRRAGDGGARPEQLKINRGMKLHVSLHVLTRSAPEPLLPEGWVCFDVSTG